MTRCERRESNRAGCMYGLGTMNCSETGARRCGARALCRRGARISSRENIIHAPLKKDLVGGRAYRRPFVSLPREWRDVLAVLAGAKPRKKPAANGNSASSILSNKGQHASFQDRPIYGNPIDFRGLRHELVTEQGVVLLFGMVAKELGYMVEAVQRGFPDCEAKRQVGLDRWQRVRIEFEFESRNFRDHGHPSTGCDVIVCWRHNWDYCPRQIEVVELSSVIKCLRQAGD